MRRKENQTEEFNAFLYNLVTVNSNEMEYSSKRQKVLINQGLSFEVLQEKQLYPDDSVYKKLEAEIKPNLDLLMKIY